MALMVVLLSGGCQDVSPKQVSAMVLSCSIGVITLSWPVVILLTLLGRRLNFVRNRAVLLQYGVYVLIQVIISLRLGLLRADLDVSIFIILAIQLQSIPYLLLVGGLLILVLPVRLLAWVPSFLLVPHYLMFGLLYVTNPKWPQPQMDVAWFFLMGLLWNVAILFGVVTLVVLFIRRRREGSRP
jgi:hypothetical protein